MRNSRGGPYLVREELPVEPGVHSYNQVRRALPVHTKSDNGSLRALRIVLLLLGIAGTGYYAYSLADEYIYQSYQNWSFDQQIAGRRRPSFGDYLRQRTPFGSLAGGQPTTPPIQPPSTPAVAPRPAHGSLLGRLSIDRLGISAIVREGTDAATLSRAVGHVPSTSLAGQAGNCSIAAHRDTLFRGLKNIHLGDVVHFQTPTATYSYRVIATQIVRPSDVSVLRADGGPRLLQQISWRPARLLTMITCYPFNYIGSAPERFIVQAEAISDSPPATTNVERTVTPGRGVQRPGFVASRRSTAVAEAIPLHQPQTGQPVPRKHF